MDPLASLIALLRPRTVLSKVVEGAGSWGVRYTAVDTAGFGLILSGSCYLTVDGTVPIVLEAGDFVLMPWSPGFRMTRDPNFEPPASIPNLVENSSLRIRHGLPEGEPQFELLGGFFEFEAVNVALLKELLPSLVHITADRGGLRIQSLVRLITDEISVIRPGRDLILERLVEVLLIETLRQPEAFVETKPGLLKGLSDPDISRALRAFHADVSHSWTVVKLAAVAGLSRSTFSERFRQAVGTSCMDYATQWRMALAKDKLRYEKRALEELAFEIGYQSASAFSTAFRRQTGHSPRDFAKLPEAALGVFR